MSVSFYPYKNLSGQLELELDFGPTPHQQMSDTEYGMYDPPLSGPTEIKVVARVPTGWKSELLHKSEQVVAPCEAVLLVRSDASRMREAIKLKQSASGKYQGSFTLDPARHAGQMDVLACLLRKEFAKKNHENYAADKGARIAWSETTRIHLSKPAVRPGNHLEIRWKSFSAPGEFLSEFSQAFSSFEETADETPALFLNQDGDVQLRHLLDYGGFGTEKAHARDAVFGAISTAAWQTMITWCLVDLHAQGLQQQGASLPDLTLLKDWQQSVVKDVAPLLYPEKSAPEALQHLLVNIVDQFSDILVRRVPPSAQQLAKVRDGYEAIARVHSYV
jgi:hypothetical protein